AGAPRARDRWARDGAAELSGGRVHRPGYRPADPILPPARDERHGGRRSGHPRHLGRRFALRDDAAEAPPAPGDRRCAARLRRRQHLPRPDRGQLDAPGCLHLVAGALPDAGAVRSADRVTCRGHAVYGRSPPASEWSPAGEALTRPEGFAVSSGARALALHRYLEASKLAFADRNRWIGDPDFFRVPPEGL